jgi:DNA-binding NarL/FixJ family response regulator
MLLETTGSRGIVIAENNDNASAFMQQGFRGVVFRNVTGRLWWSACVRVAAGDTWAASAAHGARIARRRHGRHPRPRPPHPQGDAHRRAHRQGCKNREIATRLKTTEQVIKNYLRSIYDKTGVSDRLELALFTIHHRVLAQAAAEVGSKIDAEEKSAPSAVA